MEMEKVILQKSLAWLSLSPVSSPFTKEISDLLEKKDWDSLEKCMANRIKFGTAGLRSKTAG